MIHEMSRRLNMFEYLARDNNIELFRQWFGRDIGADHIKAFGPKVVNLCRKYVHHKTARG